MPFLPLYLKALGASVVEIGIFYTINATIAVCYRIIGGWISDNIGRLHAVAFGSIAGWLGMVLMALAPTWQFMVLVVMVRQVGTSLVAPSFRAYTAESAEDDKMSSTFGLVTSFFLICNIVGPIFGGWMIENYGFRAMLWVATAIFTVAVIMRWALAFREPVRSRTQPMRFSTLNKDVRGLGAMFLSSSLLLWLFLTDGMLDAAQQLSRSFAPLYATDVGGISEQWLGWLISLTALAAALIMRYGGRFADRFGQRWGVALGAVIFASGWVIVTGFNGFLWAYVLAFGLAGAGRAFFEPAFSTLISKAVPQDSLGMTWGVFMTAFSLVSIPAPTLGGWLYDNVSPEASLYLLGLIAIIVAPLAIWQLEKPEQFRYKQQPAKPQRKVAQEPASD